VPAPSPSLRRALLSAALLASSCSPGPVSPAEDVDSPARLRLEAALRRGAIPDTVVYSDMHAYFGGEKILVRRSGVGHAERRRAGVLRVSDVVVSPLDLARLAALLVEVEAWKQREPSRELLEIDETTAGVTIWVGETKTGFWEWYNGMDERKRLARIRDLLERLVPAPPNALGDTATDAGPSR